PASDCPDITDFAGLRSLFRGVRALAKEGRVLAYHDRADGGLAVTLAEMLFAGRAGIEADVTSLGDDVVAALFSEEIGAVLQVAASDIARVEAALAGVAVSVVGKVTTAHQKLIVVHNGVAVVDSARSVLQQAWAETSLAIQEMRDNAVCAREEASLIDDD